MYLKNGLNNGIPSMKGREKESLKIATNEKQEKLEEVFQKPWR